MNKDVVIRVKNATVRFNKASGNISGLKEYIIKLLKKELMYEEFFALQNINLEIRRGEAWGLIGSNGSGKSTLLKLICGILEPYKGSVDVFGTIAPLIELSAGFDPELTAQENIFLNGALLGYSKEFMKDCFEEIVCFSELEDSLDVPIKNFSSGMSARLGFSIATVVKTDILIIDEILAVGDFSFQKKCKERIEELLSGGTTLLFVSHSEEQVREICDKAMLLAGGKLTACNDVNTVLDLYLNEQL